MLIDTRRLTGLMLSLMLSLLLASPAMAQLAAGHGKFLGNITQGGNVPSNFGQYWNQITPENEGKWGVVESSRDSYNWSGLDRAYDYARSAGIPFKQHTFVWGNQEPGWIGGLSQAEQRAEVEEFMIDYCARYPATDLIDVVNEPLSDPPSYAAALGGDGATGWDWVITAFEMARQHCPNAQLLINEYGIINDPSKRSRYVEIIDLLRQRGLIDGIGIQAHTFNVVDYSVDNLRGNLDALAQTGLPIYVSEWDINLADDQAQLQQYQQKFPVVWEHPGVAGVTLWGYIQGQTWQSDAWLVSSSGQERPALQWLRQYLQGGGSSSSSSTRSSSSSSSSSSSMPPPSSSSSSSSTGGSGACAVDYVIANDWGSGFQVNVTVRNLSSQPIDGWTLVWNLGAGESFAGGWNASFSTSGSRVTASNPAGHWNGYLAANGGTASFGFQANNSQPPANVATAFTLNGVACGGAASSSSSSASSSSSVSSSSSSSVSSSSSSSSSSSVSSSSSSTSSSSSSVSSSSSSSSAGGSALSCTPGTVDSWGSGFVLNNYTVTNTGTSPVTGWTATLSFDRTVSVTNSWGIAFATTSGSTLSGSNVSWNGNLAPGQSVTFGLQGTTSGNISPPACSAD